MLITCSSCNSKYLVNSADLKPNGRTVRCVKCSFDWYQTPDFYEDDKESLSRTVPHTSKENSNTNIDKKKKSSISNLPATYVVDNKPSLINTFFLIFLLGTIFFCFWIVKSESYSLVTLINFYIHEFYFNLKLIIKDFTKIVHRILN